jgi:hypothetical protein
LLAIKNIKGERWLARSKGVAWLLKLPLLEVKGLSFLLKLITIGLILLPLYL